MGFPGIVTVGVLSVAFLAELMTQRFGRGFYEGGAFRAALCALPVRMMVSVAVRLDESQAGAASLDGRNLRGLGRRP